MPKNQFLNSYFQKIKESAGRVADVLIECRINIVKVIFIFIQADYINNFKSDLMDVVLEWAEGAKFSEICKLTDIYEGNKITEIRNYYKDYKEIR